MCESLAIEKLKDGPNTVSSLTRDFTDLGIQPGMTLIVHSSMSSLGWVCGAAPAVILALEHTLTEEGTLVMPAHSGELSDPAAWVNPPVPATWWETIRQEMPCFDPALTPTRGLGKIPETFRKQDGVVRSSHPQLSFSAWGKHKEYIVQDRHYDYAQNGQSPLGRIYEKDGWILLIGVFHDNNTSLHLAEYKADYPTKKIIRNGMPVMENGVRQWKEFPDVEIDCDDFARLGQDFEAGHEVIKGKVGKAECRLIRQREIVDYAVKWMEEKRR